MCRRPCSISDCPIGLLSQIARRPAAISQQRCSITFELTRPNMHRRDFAPIHPGEVLLHDFMEPMGISQYRVAKEIGVPPRRINQIVHGERAVSADTALRLSRYFGLSDQYWFNLQSLYDLQVAKEQLQETLDSIEPLAA